MIDALMDIGDKLLAYTRHYKRVKGATCLACGAPMRPITACWENVGLRCESCGEGETRCHPRYPSPEHWHVVHHAPVPDELKDVIY